MGQEFWQPPQRVQSSPLPELTKEVCLRCGTDFPVGSRFCCVCGAERGTESAVGLTAYLDFHRIAKALGLGTSSLIALTVAVVCLGCAIAVGFVYTTSTLLEWQAVQVWRIEWLLAAATALLAGILLRRPQ
jgi:RNA polymerase subunit RPABC4/transcription elongation factor Spt4